MDVTSFMGAESTADETMHIAYSDDGKIYHRSYSTSWSSTNTITSDLLYYTNIGFATNSNDLYVSWKPYNSNYIKYRQYDAAPLTPQNLNIAESGNNHPLLSWDANGEPDLNYYEVWKKGGNEGGDWHIKTTTSNIYYEDPDETVVSGAQQANEGKAYYKLKAVDINNNKSTFSNQVDIRVGLDPLSKQGTGDGEIKLQYQLRQNYPNPFNPSTQITYTIAQDAEVVVKIYDMLGTEVAELVNKTQTAGIYDVNFNAKNLSSGIYIYRITASSKSRVIFSDAKRMLLIK